MRSVTRTRIWPQALRPRSTLGGGLFTLIFFLSALASTATCTFAATATPDVNTQPGLVSPNASDSDDFLLELVPLLAAARFAKKPSIRAPRNVLLFLADDQGYHLSSAGTAGIQTPHIDALATQGVFFEHAYATAASCSPSRTSILTGTYSHTNGVWRNVRTPTVTAAPRQFTRNGDFIDTVGVRNDVPTLIEILNDSGFRTGITRKWHLSPPWRFPFTDRLGGSLDPVGYANLVRNFISRDDGRPFFLVANIDATHRPFVRNDGTLRSHRVDPSRIDVPPELAGTLDMRLDLAEYLSNVQLADTIVGAVLDVLRESGKYDDTLIIYTSDQGYAFHRAKASPYIDGTHVPLVMKGPGIVANAQLPHLVSLADLMPTILDIFDIPIPSLVDGRSLLPLLEGDTETSWRSVVFWEHNAHGPAPASLYPSRAAFDGRMHYIRNMMPERTYRLPADLVDRAVWGTRSYDTTVASAAQFPSQYQLLLLTLNRPREELYDLSNDPGQTRNVLTDPKYASHLQLLRAQVSQWMQNARDTGDPRLFPVWH